MSNFTIPQRNVGVDDEFVVVFVVLWMTTPGGWWDLKNAHSWRGAACMPSQPRTWVNEFNGRWPFLSWRWERHPSPCLQQGWTIGGIIRECMGINNQHEMAVGIKAKHYTRWRPLQCSIGPEHLWFRCLQNTSGFGSQARVILNRRQDRSQ